jgi:hypothetical protein
LLPSSSCLLAASSSLRSHPTENCVRAAHGSLNVPSQNLIGSGGGDDGVG